MKSAEKPTPSGEKQGITLADGQRPGGGRSDRPGGGRPDRPGGPRKDRPVGPRKDRPGKKEDEEETFAEKPPEPKRPG